MGDDVASDVSKPRGITAPLVYLRESSGRSKHKDIVDYIHLVIPVSEDHVIKRRGDVQVLFRTAPRKPSLQNISRRGLDARQYMYHGCLVHPRGALR